METTGVFPIRKYARRWKATITNYVSGIPIYELLIGSEHMEGSSRFLRW